MDLNAVMALIWKSLISEIMMLRLVNSKEEIVDNIFSFTQALNETPRNPIFEQSGRFKCWYAYKDELNNEWCFGPSKYIGYAEISIDIYNKTYPELDGKITEKQLSKFSSDIDDITYSYLQNELFKLLSHAGRIPSKSAKIKIIEGVKKNMLTKKINYETSDECRFYYEDEKPSIVNISNFIRSDVGIKFDLQWGDSRYFVSLNKKTDFWYCEGIASYIKTGEKIDIAAFVKFHDNGDIDILGDKWFENGYNALWTASVCVSR